MVKKNGKKETVKKAATPDVEYSGNLTPSAGRVKEAGYGKTTDLELADVGKNYGGAGNENTNRGIETEGEINPLVTGIAKTNTKTDENFEIGDLKMGNGQLENDNAGLNRDYNDAPPSTGDTTGNLKDGSQPDYNFEVADLDKKEKLPAEKANPGEAENQ
ncbi:MAG TPA: hypothetical protein VHY08_03645 [Bacillota bacterium]|nr:hypothetical protein [Bacillota bacterium]